MLVKILIAFVIAIFAAAFRFGVKPTSSGGKLTLKLILLNAGGWILLFLLVPDTGHPPPALIALALFWLVNCVLIPAGVAGLWNGYKSKEENTRFLSLAGVYLGLNVVVLFLIPLFWLIVNRTIPTES